MLTVAAAAGVVHLIKADVTPADGVSDTTLHAFTDDMDASAPHGGGQPGELITVPDMERIPGDVETVQRLVGDYLSKLDAGLTVGSTTITLGTFLIDESGCGILTYAVDDPEGVSYEEAGYGEVYGLPLEPPHVPAPPRLPAGRQHQCQAPRGQDHQHRHPSGRGGSLCRRRDVSEGRQPLLHRLRRRRGGQGALRRGHPAPHLRPRPDLHRRQRRNDPHLRRGHHHGQCLPPRRS